MSKSSENALALIAVGSFDEAKTLAFNAVQQTPDDWHAHYTIGQWYRSTNDYRRACESLVRANQLAPDQPPTLLALAIAQQLGDDYSAAINTLQLALEVDPDYAPAYNTLAMTQKLMGAYDTAAHNYAEGANALARTISLSLSNVENSPRSPDWHSRHDLWAEYALVGALHLAARASVDGVAWPTGDMAARDAHTQEFRGWFWNDLLDDGRRTTRLYLPNYFNTFSQCLRLNSLYANLMGNRSTVLRLMAQDKDAEQHLHEAEDFASANRT